MADMLYSLAPLFFVSQAADDVLAVDVVLLVVGVDVAVGVDDVVVVSTSLPR